MKKESNGDQKKKKSDPKLLRSSFKANLVAVIAAGIAHSPAHKS